ncbi:hypothetical protein FB005_12468 [Sinorhizobium medicae]|nr:hypothetical protein FB006_14020 [Sinorhizobium medicae]TWA37028.1 hypothetical protein FB005_12468 [Sinorhizobium medicae]
MLHLGIGENLANLSSVPTGASHQGAVKHDAATKAKIKRLIAERLILNPVSGEQLRERTTRPIVAALGAKATRRLLQLVNAGPFEMKA